MPSAGLTSTTYAVRTTQKNEKKKKKDEKRKCPVLSPEKYDVCTYAHRIISTTAVCMKHET